MRKTFKLFCAAAMAALAVSSCYDDSFLRGEIDRLDGRVDSLASVINQDVASIAALQSSVATLETTLKQAITDGDAAVKKALEDALAKAQADLKKAHTDLEAAIAAGDKANADALAALKAELEKSLKALETALAAVTTDVEALGSVTKDIETLQAALKALEATVGTNYNDLLKKLDAVDGVVDGHIADMKTAIEALKATDEVLSGADSTLNANLVAALAKIAVTKVAEVNGKIVLTLADGKTVELSKPLTNVDNNGLVTIVEVDGVKYWSVVGAETHTGVPVGHPDYAIEFQINNDGELVYRVNEGEWISTGISNESAINTDFLITGFEEEEEYVTITMGETEIVLPKYVTEAEDEDDAVLMVKSGKTYFDFEETIEFELSIAEVESYYVISKPDGWRAKVKDGALTVTAPAEAFVTAGTAEAEGQVLLHANTNDGLCKVASLMVSTAASGFTMTIDDAGTLCIVNPVVYTTMDDWGYENSAFADVYIGLAPISEFEKNPVNYVNSVYNAEVEGIAGDLTYIKYYYGLGGNYNAVEYTDEWNGTTYPQYLVDEFDLTVNQLYYYFKYDNPPKGSQFVVYAVPCDDKGMLLMDDMVYVYYAPVEVVASVKSSTFNEIEMNLEVYGATQYYVGINSPKYMGTYLNEETGVVDIDGYMQASEGPFGTIQRALMLGMPQYAFDGMGTLFENTGATTINLSEINYGEQLSPSTPYYVWVFPVIEGKDLSTYEYEKHLKPYIYTYNTQNLTSGGEVSVALPDEPSSQEYTSVSVSVAAPEDAKLIYYYPYDPETINEISDLAADLIQNGIPTTETEFTMKSDENYNLELLDDSPVVFAVLAVDADGKYGTPVQKTYKTKAVVINEQLSATITASPYTYTNSGGDKYTTVYLKVASENTNLKSIRYYCEKTTDFNIDQDELAYNTGSEQPIQYLTNGYFKLTYRKADTEYKLGYVCVDTEGNVSAYKEITFNTPAENSVINATNVTPATTVYDPAAREYSTNTNETLNKVKVTVNVPEGSIAWWALNNDIVEESFVLDFVTGNESDATFFTGTKYQTFNCSTSKSGFKFYLVMMDAEGNFTYYVEDIDAYITAEKAKLQ